MDSDQTLPACLLPSRLSSLSSANLTLPTLPMFPLLSKLSPRPIERGLTLQARRTQPPRAARRDPRVVTEKCGDCFLSSRRCNVIKLWPAAAT